MANNSIKAAFERMWHYVLINLDTKAEQSDVDTLHGLVGNTAEEGTGVVPVLPRVATITLAANGWKGNSSPYSQSVNIATVTAATKVELNPTVSQIVSLQNDDIALMAENNNGAVTVYAFGDKPSSTMTMQATLTEVSYV